MNMIPVVIRPYLPFYPHYGGADWRYGLVSLFCIDCTWFKPLNQTYCQSSHLGTGLYFQIHTPRQALEAQFNNKPS